MSTFIEITKEVAGYGPMENGSTGYEKRVFSKTREVVEYLSLSQIRSIIPNNGGYANVYTMDKEIIHTKHSVDEMIEKIREAGATVI